METPDPPKDTPGALKQVVLTPHDIPRILRAQGIFEFTLERLEQIEAIFEAQNFLSKI